MFFQLNPGYLLQGDKYKIIKLLGQGGFGITYLAEQTLMERKVCIKEFFMKEYCNRDEATNQVSLGTQNNAEMMQKYQEKFLKEARMIARLDHPNIIRIFDVFTENNTAYYVMEYIEGKSLNELVKESGALPEAVAIEYVRQIGEGLAYVHDHNINHLDIKPGNILVRKSDNRPILIDFGMSKQYDESGDRTSSTPLGISEGYAPLEMYRMGGVSSFSPQTDIYELGATLFRLVTGVVPPSASDIINEGLPEFPSNISSSTKTAIEKAMEYRKKDRPESMTSFLSLLSVMSAKTPQPEKTPKNKKAPQTKKAPKVVEKRAETPPEDDAATVIVETVETQYGSKAERRYLDAANGGDTEAQYQLSKCFENGKDVKKNSKEALKWLKSAADGGHAIAQLEMGNRYYEGKGLQQDYVEAFKWFQQAAEQGDKHGQFKLGNCYYEGNGVPRDVKEAMKWFLKSAEQGHPDAQYMLGECYTYDTYKNGIKQDFPEAVKWYNKAAEQGNANAMERLGDCYTVGNGVQRDYSKAFQYYFEAAKKGVSLAQHNLGLCYLQGRGVSQDFSEAIFWLKKDADQGSSRSQFQLGKCYYDGVAIKRDFARAFDLYKKSALQNYVWSYYPLALCYWNGTGTQVNYAEAFKWFKKGADQGIAVAQYYLGNCYYYGHGVPKNLAEAINWYRKAADHGIALAQYCLGNCYYYGHGVPKDNVEAAVWFHKAADQGLASAQYKYGCCINISSRVSEAVTWWRKAAEQGEINAQCDFAVCCYLGLGVKRDPEEGKRWLLKAEQGGHPDARKLMESRLARLSWLYRQ